jgi:spore maturation protein CgeB
MWDFHTTACSQSPSQKVSTFRYDSWGHALKFTIFGLTLSSSWGNGHATPYRAILRALHRLGHDIVFYEKDVPYYARRRDFTDADFCLLHLYTDWNSIRSQALNDVRDSDVVINASYCPEGARICDEALAIAGPLHVFYDLDTPITLENLRHGDVEYLRADQIPALDLVLSFTGGKTLEELENFWGAQKARPLYGCVDPDIYHRVPVREDFRCLLSYMGTYARDRQHKLDQLFLEPARERSLDTFVLAGSLYPWDWAWSSNIHRIEHVSPNHHPAFYSSSKFTLNITRDGMARGGYCPSGRFFEAAACGTPIISDWFEGLDSFFTPGEEIFVVRDSWEVIHTLGYPDTDLRRVARRARERTLAAHSGTRRAQQLLTYLESVGRTNQPSLEVA